MSEFWNAIDKLGDILDETSETMNTASHGINRVRSSKDHVTRLVNRYQSGESDADWDKIMEYRNRESRCIRRTVIFCILMIAVTILVCYFM